MVYRIYFAMGFIILGQWLTGQDRIPIWNNHPVGEHLEIKQAESETKGNVTRLSNVTWPALTKISPLNAKDNGDAIVVCPGGGYRILAWDKEGTEIGEWLAEQGYTAYILEYRIPQQREAALQDVTRSIRMVRSLSGADAKVGVLGFSAGGHLAASAATRFDKQTYDSADAIDNKNAEPDFAVLIYPAYLDKGESGGLSPEINLKTTTKPVFISVSADDPYANSSLVLANALHRNQTSVEFHLFPEGGHGYGMRKGIEAAEAWPNLLEKWLKNR